MVPSTDSLRIDRWLFYCRFYKTRVRATAAVSGGHVRLNGERPSAGARVKRGDRIELVKERLPYAFEVTELPLRRGPATEARRCYREDVAVVAERESLIASLKQDRLLKPRTNGRPDKRTRQRLRSRNRGGD